MESDHCQVIQSHLYYRYTNGQKISQSRESNPVQQLHMLLCYRYTTSGMKNEGSTSVLSQHHSVADCSFTETGVEPDFLGVSLL